MARLGRIAAQGALYALFAAFVAFFSSAPRHAPLGPGEALLRLSFSQPGKLVGECRRLDAEELAALEPTMRVLEDCPRERSPIEVRIEVDGDTVLDASFAPSGIRRDGAASAYRRIPLAAGAHRLRVSVRDDLRPTATPYVRDTTVELAAGEVVLIDFAADRGGVLIR